MAITLVQHADGYLAGSYNIVSAQFPSNVTAGNFLVAAFSYNNSSQSISSFADDHFGNWSGLSFNYGGGSATGFGYLPALVATGGVRPTLTLTLSGNSGIALTIMEFSGVLATTDANGTHTTGGATSASVSTSAATTTVGQLVLVAFGKTPIDTWTAGSGYTLISSNNFVGSQWAISGALAVQTASMSIAGAAASLNGTIATFVAGSPATLAPTTVKGSMNIRSTSQS